MTPTPPQGNLGSGGKQVGGFAEHTGNPFAQWVLWAPENAASMGITVPDLHLCQNSIKH